MKFDVKPSKRKKKDPIRDLIVTGALGYTAYKLLSKNEKKENERKNTCMVLVDFRNTNFN